jgi:hypothetical protein
VANVRIVVLHGGLCRPFQRRAGKAAVLGRLDVSFVTTTPTMIG